jgi:DNA-binding NarL/FixJ family response regulator
MAIMQRLRSLSSLASDKQEGVLPSVLRSAIEREARNIVIDDLRVHFCEIQNTGVTTATELISIQFSRDIKKQSQAKASVSLGDLTPAEQRVLPLLLEGLRNKEIADRLNSSVHTIKHHVSSILAKARCSDRLLLVAKASAPMEGSQPKKLVVAPLPEGNFLPPSMTQAKATKPA